jgi:RNA polymerase sigma-70 factor (ECF subfamily)
MNNQKMKLSSKINSRPIAAFATGPQIDEVFRVQQARVLFRCRQWLTQPRDAEDACQEVFFRVARAWETFRAECKIETWIFLITRNVCRNFNRRARRRRHGQGLEYQDHIASSLPPEHQQEVLSQEDVCMQRQMIQNLKSGLSQLTQSSQEIMRLKIEQGLTYEEVAVKLGVPPGTIKSRVFRARSQLRSVLMGD